MAGYVEVHLQKAAVATKGTWDIVGDKILEINVFSPGGLVGAGRQAKVNFMPIIIKALEKKVKTQQAHPGKYTNLELATL